MDEHVIGEESVEMPESDGADTSGHLDERQLLQARLQERERLKLGLPIAAPVARPSVPLQEQLARLR